MFDFHNHYTNWAQFGGDFFGLIKAMDDAGVENMAIFGLPTIASDGPYLIDTKIDSSLLDRYVKLSKGRKQRLFPFICGINPESPATIQYVKQMLSDYEGSIYGIGEVICRHDDRSIAIFGKEMPPNTPTMFELSDLAEEYGMPMLIHSNVAKPGDTEPVFLAEMEELFAHNKKTQIVWAHCGISNDIDDMPLSSLLDMLDRLFGKYENAHVDLTWKVFVYYIDGKEKEWVDLIEKYPERFLIGTDLTGKLENYSSTIHQYDTLLGLLSERAADLLKHGNAERLLFRK